MRSLPIRVGLLGFGASAKTFHLPFLLARPDLFTVTAVLERQAVEAPRLVPAARVHRDADAFFADKEWDLCVVTLPNDLHAPMALKALASGRSVIVEKPLSVTAEEGRAVVEAARKAGIPAFAYHNRRLDGDFQLVRSLVGKSALGRLVRAEVRYERWANALRKKAWKETGLVGSSLLEDLGSHLLDQACALFGMPSAVTCRLGVQRDGSQTVDAFRISLDYGAPWQGLWVDLEAGMVARAPQFHWSLQGTGGAFVKSGFDTQESQLQKGLVPGTEGFGDEPTEQSGILYPASGEPERLVSPPGRYADFYTDVAEVLTHGTAPRFPAEDGLRVVRLLELCRQSAAEARTVAVT
jgi:scyllo-inositol 2-dehydrogenase (NADP+)